MRQHLAIAVAIASIANVTGAAQSAPGSYQLTFVEIVAGEPVPATTLPVCTSAACKELILKAHVEDSSGVPVQGGLVTFQYCSLKGLPSNDFSRPDEAPSSACATRAGSWANLGTFAIPETDPYGEMGNAYMNFGIVLIPRTVGFRFKYSGRGGGVAKGTSAPRDFTWVAAP
jgi:hypothetical protein